MGKERFLFTYTLLNIQHHRQVMISAIRFIALFSTLLIVAGCGLKGPLYFPPPEPVEVQQPPNNADSKPKSASLKSMQQKDRQTSQDATGQSQGVNGGSQSSPNQPNAK